MTPPSHPSWPRLITIALVVFAAAFAITLLAGFAQAKSHARPHLTVLGSGNRLSLLVVDGPARLLIATGDDPAAFGNALAGSRPFGRDRIDVLLLADTESDLTFLSRADRAADTRHVEVIGKPELVANLALPSDALLVSPRRFRLMDRTIVTIETLDRAGAESGPSFAWRALIEHGASRILVLSDDRVAAEFPRSGRVSALIVGGESVDEALRVVDTGAVIASAGEITGKKLRADVAGATEKRIWLIRVHPGESAEFDFTDRGLALPDNAEQVDGTPIPGQSTPSPGRRAATGAEAVRLAEIGQAEAALAQPLTARSQPM